eukprot:8340715-Alexandrium_andersonii.AAC.1
MLHRRVMSACTTDPRWCQRKLYNEVGAGDCQWMGNCPATRERHDNSCDHKCDTTNSQVP